MLREMPVFSGWQIASTYAALNAFFFFFNETLWKLCLRKAHEKPPEAQHLKTHLGMEQSTRSGVQCSQYQA